MTPRLIGHVTLTPDGRNQEDVAVEIIDVSTDLERVTVLFLGGGMGGGLATFLYSALHGVVVQKDPAIRAAEIIADALSR